MKARFGFVSNSSSSSFLIYGTFLSDGEVLELLNEKEVEEDEEGEDGYDEDAYSLVSDAASEEGLSVESPEGCGGYFVGLSWDEVKDDETGKEFKARVEKALLQIFGKDANIDFRTFSEAWYNG